METNEYAVLKVFASSTDKIRHKLLFEHIVIMAKENGIGGVTVYRGIMGYGVSSKDINSSKFWELTEKLPVVVEIIDSIKKIEDFYEMLAPDLIKMGKGCLVTIEPIKIKLHVSGHKK